MGGANVLSFGSVIAEVECSPLTDDLFDEKIR